MPKARQSPRIQDKTNGNLDSGEVFQLDLRITAVLLRVNWDIEKEIIDKEDR